MVLGIKGVTCGGCAARVPKLQPKRPHTKLFRNLALSHQTSTAAPTSADPGGRDTRGKPRSATALSSPPILAANHAPLPAGTIIRQAVALPERGSPVTSGRLPSSARAHFRRSSAPSAVRPAPRPRAASPNASEERPREPGRHRHSIPRATAPPERSPPRRRCGSPPPVPSGGGPLDHHPVARLRRCPVRAALFVRTTVAPKSA